MEKTNYTYTVRWSEQDREHVGLCEQFPSLSWLAKTPEEALRGIKELVKGCTDDIQNETLKMPR
jgi:predicted RNase H-like HicB family nuclease